MGFLILRGSWSHFISENLSYRPWRLLLIVNTVPGCLAALCLSRLPESGKCLLSRGQDTAALDVLQRIYRLNSGRPADTFTVKHLLPENDGNADTANEKCAEQMPANGCLQLFWRQTVPLFQRPLRTHFLICCFLVFGVFFVSAGIGMWYPEIQNRIAHSNSTAGRTVCDVLESAVLLRNESLPVDGDTFGAACNDTVADRTFQDYGALGGYYVLMYVVYSLGIQRLGQGVFLVTFLFVSGLAGLSLQWVAQPLTVVVLFSSHIVFSGICISMLTGIVVTLIPTEYR